MQNSLLISSLQRQIKLNLQEQRERRPLKQDLDQVRDSKESHKQIKSSFRYMVDSNKRIIDTKTEIPLDNNLVKNISRLERKNHVKSKQTYTISVEQIYKPPQQNAHYKEQPSNSLKNNNIPKYYCVEASASHSKLVP